jgi:uncharacterized protein YprB with RNaseH-like and TPR domain
MPAVRGNKQAKHEDWTPKEDRLLLALRKKKASYSELAACLPRHSQDAIRQHYFVLTRNEPHWTEAENLAFFDLETSHLKANIGILLSWAFKLRGGGVVYDVITKKDIMSGVMDRRIVKSFMAAIKPLDVLIGYYSTKFDVPFIRTRALMLGIPFPAFGQQFHHDVYYSAKWKLDLHSNRLDAVSHALGCKNEKTPLDISIWQKAQYGDPKCLAYIVEHNKADVRVLEEVFEKLMPFIQMKRKSL